MILMCVYILCCNVNKESEVYFGKRRKACVTDHCKHISQYQVFLCFVFIFSLSCFCGMFQLQT